MIDWNDLRRLWERLIAPPLSIRDPVARHRTRFLNSLLVIFIPLSLFVYSIQLFVMPTTTMAQDTATKSVIMGISVVLILYVVNHTPYHTIANYLAIGIGFIAILANVAASEAPHVEIAYLILLPLVGILLLSMREIVVVCLLTIAVFILFAKFTGDIRDDIFKDLLSFMIIIEAFIIFASHQRNLLEVDRQRHLIENEKIRILAQFFQDVSHEFRTPLSIINTGLYLVNRIPDAEVRQQRISGMQTQIMYITRLLDDMLTMTRLDSRTAPALNAVVVDDLLRDLASRAAPEAAAKGLTLNLALQSDSAVVMGDGEELEAALTHLVKNALAYTAQGGVTLRTFRQSDMVVIEVEDSGIGIPEADNGRIFERFYRVDQARSTPGAGLGLAITKKIIEDHHGSIEVESVLGQGSLFRVTLPGKAVRD